MIDWETLHKRLAQTGMAIEHDTRRSPEAAAQLLRARARGFAQQVSAPRTQGHSVDVLGFRLAYEDYGIEVPFISEVRPLKAFTPLPGLPPFMLGIINVRGRVLSVIDLKKVFELPGQGLSDLNKVIIIQDKNMMFGILADAIAGIRPVADADIQTTLPTLTGIRQQYLKGVTRERMVLLDATKLLADQVLIVNQPAL